MSSHLPLTSSYVQRFHTREVEMPAKFNLLVVASVPFIPLLACGGGSNTVDAHIQVTDSPGSNPKCAVASSLGSPTFSQSNAAYFAGSAADATNTLLWQGVLPGTTGATTQAVEVLINGGCGNTTGAACGGFTTPDWPSTFGAKSGVDVGSAGLDAAIEVLADLGSDNKFHTIYLSTVGTLNITTASNTAGATFAGNAANVTVVHADFGSNGATADPDGCQSTITSFSFTGSAQAGFTGKGLIAPEQSAETLLSHRWR
jgi:hypothetical protein